ncbi:Imm40 family immunity protein [Leptospira santarosai]|uniref:Imm40 family immunity protein n=1 Tax=Leptospira santarosai TaxID=28183 RepID=UPI0009B7C9C3|nr:Imm40 family immunity protein [Leptospira santarosai]MDI7175390.1 Imm40 family immunity protein [Leptospira santarosai]MDI7195074.1 Imm40 family immunity protein [Leptospira santarosai]MDO6399442.1 Imm40 family immunity protein [Leptospira santarosai]MDO6404915.1 Imm40 family immunity protein [Leptospira santarosai]UZN08150.1 Imm40 family immunity protein [Leptospira santarosai]
MDYLWPREIYEILNIGVHLSDVGVNNWALTKDQALLALEKFLKLDIPISGGDVYEYRKGIIESNYNNWYCNPDKMEANSEYVKRSIEKAVKYIQEYKIKENHQIYFVLIPEVE